jgi:hypothetical protein
LLKTGLSVRPDNEITVFSNIPVFLGDSPLFIIPLFQSNTSSWAFIKFSPSGGNFKKILPLIKGRYRRGYY